MKIKSVKIGGSKHKVIYCAIENSYGMYDKDERIIYINKNLHHQKQHLSEKRHRGQMKRHLPQFEP